MAGFWSTVFGRQSAASPSSDRVSHHLKLPEPIPLTYVVGDIHGMLALYRKLETRIAEDAAGRPALIVSVGDIVDRGPESGGLIEFLQSRPPDGLQRLILKGNHEEMFVQFLDAPRQNRRWLDYGGRETLASYGIYGDPVKGFDLPERRLRQMIAASIPEEDIAWLRTLPEALHLGERYFVCHAGIDPDKALPDQTSRDLLWSRGMTAPPPDGVTVVHGHVPVENVDLTGPYIDVDTGAYASGRLTTLRVTPGQAPALLEVA